MCHQSREGHPGLRFEGLRGSSVAFAVVRSSVLFLKSGSRLWGHVLSWVDIQGKRLWQHNPQSSPEDCRRRFRFWDTKTQEPHYDRLWLLIMVLTLVGYCVFTWWAVPMAKQSSWKQSASNSVHPIRPLLVRQRGVLNFQVALDLFALLKVEIMSWHWRRWMLAWCNRKDGNGERKRATKAEKDSLQIHNTVLPSTTQRSLLTIERSCMCSRLLPIIAP